MKVRSATGYSYVHPNGTYIDATERQLNVDAEDSWVKAQVAAGNIEITEQDKPKSTAKTAK